MLYNVIKAEVSSEELKDAPLAHSQLTELVQHMPYLASVVLLYIFQLVNVWFSLIY